MQTTTLGNTGTQVSKLALGCMLMGTATSEADSVEMLHRYVDGAGGSFLDTADCYAWWSSPESQGGESEELLGRWFAQTGRRDEIFLATKGTALPRDLPGLWANPQEPDWAKARQQFAGASRAALTSAMEASLRRLGTDYVDLYYVHVDDLATPLEDTLETLAGFVAAGKVKHLGWSNVRTWRLESIRQLCDRYGWPAPVAVQQQHSYLRPRPGSESASIVGYDQLDYLQRHAQTLVAYSPILKGVYDVPEKRTTSHVMTEYAGPDTDARFAAVEKIAAEVGATPNQVVLAWLLRQDLVTLIGPRTLPQYDSAVPALGLSLTDAQVAYLDAA
ncbi:aldo/keto reductase [Hamadaea sp. NPDC051192]|uniref:aldo/keto reductase n=1 Tax=Hamadaea sp. NPDC051192 TaxID=3154940 RepID=UPI00344A2111